MSIRLDRPTTMAPAELVPGRAPGGSA